MRTYTELSQLQTFEERYEYLRLDGIVGQDTFGFDRYLNQNFYRSAEWKRIRDQVIVRDMGCDLGIAGADIYGKIIIHHMNPITSDDVLRHSQIMIDPENLICVSQTTHNLIHYGVDKLPDRNPVERTPNDTCPWKH